MDRYYLFKLFGFGVFLHKIHHDDPQGLYHNHPWSGLSVIFGSYMEFSYDPKLPTGGEVNPYKLRQRRWFNWIPATRYHQVTLICERPVWTLFFHLPKSNKWSVIDDSGKRVETPWEGEGTGRSYRAALATRWMLPSKAGIWLRDGSDDEIIVRNELDEPGTWHLHAYRSNGIETEISMLPKGGWYERIRGMQSNVVAYDDTMEPSKLAVVEEITDPSKRLKHLAAIDAKYLDARKAALERANRWNTGPMDIKLRSVPGGTVATVGVDVKITDVDNMVRDYNQGRNAVFSEVYGKGNYVAPDVMKLPDHDGESIGVGRMGALDEGPIIGGTPCLEDAMTVRRPLEPITISKSGMVLDGNKRLSATADAGYETILARYVGSTDTFAALIKDLKPRTK